MGRPEAIRGNVRWLFRSRGWLFGLFVLALLCDGVSTAAFMLKDGPGVELHPGVRMAGEVLGPVAGPLVAVVVKALAAVVVVAVCRWLADPTLMVGAVVSLWAAWSNWYNWWGHAL